jgi:hypothetical protein
VESYKSRKYTWWFMRIFLSYASPDKSDAEAIAFSLRSRGYKVFLDKDDLPAGRSYDDQLERAVKESQIFIFLISPDSIVEGRFALTELKFARKKWKDPSGRVLPVMVRKTPLSDVPSYLKAVTILQPTGNIAAETSAAVQDMWQAFARRRLIVAFGTSCAVAVLVFFLVLGNPGPDPGPGPAPKPVKCNEEGTLRSLEGNVQTTIVFANKGNQPIRAYWLDYAGRRISYGMLGTGQIFSTQTYVTHPWLIADAEDNCKAIYLPTADRLEVSIDG